MGQISGRELMELMGTRRSVRRFRAGGLDPDTGERLVEAAVTAPTAGNVQPWHFVLAESRLVREKLSEAALSQRQVADAPLVVVVCVDLERARRAYGRRGEALYCIQDSAAATQNMLLMAHAMGLATCWVGAFDERAVGEVIDLASHLRPVALIAVGVSERKPPGPGRRPLEEVVDRR